MSTTLITPSAEAFLPAFNGQLNLKDACTWSLTQMKAFMLGLINSPSTHGVDENVIGEMRRLRTDIFDLCENGSKDLSEASHPQSISRIVNPNHSKDTSYFLLDSMPYRGIPYWCCHDLLGRFLSVFSPAPEGATQDNFYLPLTTMYAKWCIKMAPYSPWTYACVWAEEEGRQSHFHLGGSFAGYRNPEGQSNYWVEILRKARFDVLRDARIDTANITIFDSTYLTRGTNIVPFGNWAETYPLVHILRNHGPREEVYCLALKRKDLSQDAYNHQEALQALVGPCVNCEKVITAWGGKLENFTDNITEKSTAPSSRVQDPAAEGLKPASESNIALSVHAKRPTAADGADQPEARSTRGLTPVIPLIRTDSTDQLTVKRTRGLTPVIPLIPTGDTDQPEVKRTRGPTPVIPLKPPAHLERKKQRVVTI